MANTASSKFNERHDKLSVKLIATVQEYLDQGLPPYESARRALVETGYREEITDAILDEVLKGLYSGGIRVVANPSALRKWWLNRHWTGQDMSLSQKIATTDFEGIIAEAINVGLSEARSWTEIAKSITDTDLINGQLPKHLDKLTTAARRSLSGNPDAIRAYNKALNESARQIARLAQNNAPTMRLKAAYEDVIKATQKGTEKAISKAIDRAVKEKAYYNAQRISRTEKARAYGQASITKAAEDTDVIGVTWITSSRHLLDDICSFNANADLYGMGKGVYPVDKLPKFPSHPNCMCSIGKKYKGDIGEFDPKQGEKLLKSLPVEQQKKLFGIDGQKQFRENPEQWQGLLKEYDPNGPRPELPQQLVNP